MCMHKNGNWRKWTLNLSQGRNGHRFLPSARKTKWLRMTSASADRSPNMNVFFTLRIHVQGKETSVCPCVYLAHVCRCRTGKTSLCMCVGVFPSIASMVWYVLLGSFGCPQGPVGPRCPPGLTQPHCPAVSLVNQRASLCSDTPRLLYWCTATNP